MGVHGTLGDEQSLGDVANGQTFGDQLGHLQFSSAQGQRAGLDMVTASVRRLDRAG